MEIFSVMVESGGAAFQLLLPNAPDDPVVQAYASGQVLNDYLVDLLRLLVPSRGTVLDLGCHVGTFTLAAAALGHRVIAVDAFAGHCDLVRASAEENGFEGVTVVHSAVSDCPGVVRFEERGLFGHVMPDADDGDEVRAATIPHLLSEAGVAPDEVDFIKMDVEGSELRALSGAAEWLSSAEAPPILYESNPRTAEPFGYSVDGLRTALLVLGYQTYRPEPDGLFLCPPEEPQPEGWTDFLAVKSAELGTRGIEAHGPMPKERLVAKFDYWSQDPDDEIRAYTANELVRHWQRFKDSPVAQTTLLRLAADSSAEVKRSMSAMRRRPLFPRLRRRINVRRAKLAQALSRRT